MLYQFKLTNSKRLLLKPSLGYHTLKSQGCRAKKPPNWVTYQLSKVKGLNPWSGTLKNPNHLFLILHKQCGLNSSGWHYSLGEHVGNRRLVRSHNFYRQASKRNGVCKDCLYWVRLDKIDKGNPHPLLLQDVLKDSAVFHAAVFPWKNVKISLGSIYDAIRNIVYDSMRIDEDGGFYETLKWLSYQKWETKQLRIPSFECPHCHDKIEGLAFDANDALCGYCRKKVFLTDMITFHLDIDEQSAPDTVESAYMLVMEHIMLLTEIRLLWSHADKHQCSKTELHGQRPTWTRQD